MLQRLFEQFIRILFLRQLLSVLLFLLQPVAKLWHTINQPWRDFLQRFSPFQQNFIKNMLIGFAIALFIASFGYLTWLQDLEDFAMDSMIKLHHRLPHTQSDKTRNLRFSVFDIDEASQRVWGEPFYTPRDKIKQLIELAVEKKAKLILLDVDLSHQGDAKQDKALLNLLRQYNRENTPPLVLLRTFYPPLNRFDKKQKQAEIRPLFFESESLGDNIFWAQPMFQRHPIDQQVRRWFLVQAGCLHNQVVLLPSFQLITAAFFQQRYPELEQALQHAIAAEKSDHPNHCKPSTLKTLQYGTQTLDVAPPNLGERIMYSLSWQQARQQTADVRWFSAAELLKTCAEGCADDQIKNNVVIIGASHAYSGDVHFTPLGEMSGTLIIVNAIKSFVMHGQLKPPPLWLKWGLALAMIVLMAWAFAKFNSLRATLISGLVLVVGLLPLSYWLFKFGIWVDFAVPIVAMQFHQLLAKRAEERALLQQGNHR